MVKTQYAMIYSEYACPDDLPVVAFSQDHWTITNESVSFLHCHNCFEITYWVEGDGFFQIENVEHPVHAGDMCVLCQNSMHLSYVGVGNDRPSRCHYLYVDVDKFSAVFPMKIDKLDYLKYHSPQFVNVISREDCPELEIVLKAIFREMEEQAANYQASVLSLVAVFLTLVLRNQRLSDHYCPIAYEGKFSIAASIDYMNEHYAEKVTTERLAEVCHMSPTNYRRIFRNVMQMPPMTYLSRVRVEKACARLFDTNSTVLEISESVGFQSVCSLNRSFRQFINSTPLEWRKSARLSR